MVFKQYLHQQAVLLPLSLEEMDPAGHPVRTVSANCIHILYKYGIVVVIAFFETPPLYTPPWPVI